MKNPEGVTQTSNIFSNSIHKTLETIDTNIYITKTRVTQLGQAYFFKQWNFWPPQEIQQPRVLDHSTEPNQICSPKNVPCTTSHHHLQNVYGPPSRIYQARPSMYHNYVVQSHHHILNIIIRIPVIDSTYQPASNYMEHNTRNSLNY